ncbi:ABC transporter substrate-binding protein [Rhodococcus sp. NPDC060176]|uniref:ABC transporter substrate-binding protein n=1 Tax=Rhodococcus sp. NPDC060176 TaxID=3347062 RepID=UPI003651CC1D
MKRSCLLPPLVLAIALVLSACSSSETSSATDSNKVTIALDWLAQPTNAGAYVALENGYYSDVGLDVAVQPGGTEASSVKIVAGGGAQFGLEYGGPLLAAREKGIDVVALAPTLQKSPAVYVYHADQNINSLADLNGRTVYTQPSSGDWELTVEEFGLDKADAVQFQGSYAPFATDPTAVAQGYATSTPAVLAAQGIEVKTIPRISENDYGSVLFTTRKLIDDNPELVRKFVAGTAKGWDFIRDNPRKAAEILASYIEDSSVDAILAEFDAQVPFIWSGDADAHQFGWQTQTRWDSIYDLQVRQGTVTDLKVLDGAWTTDYLPAS